MVGLDNRSTMDVDATIRNLPLSEENARDVVEEITAVPIEDGMAFEIKSIATIMDEADYPGVRVMLDTTLETMLSRGTANTRMRDFYDIYTLEAMQSHTIEPTVLRDAFTNTSKKRGSSAVIGDAALILNEIRDSFQMVALWKNYQRKFDYASDVAWDDVMGTVRKLYGAIGSAVAGTSQLY